jgi:hypothetical protein
MASEPRSPKVARTSPDVPVGAAQNVKIPLPSAATPLLTCCHNTVTVAPALRAGVPQ